MRMEHDEMMPESSAVFHSTRATAMVDVVAEDVVDVAAVPPLREKKKKKSKSASAKLVEGVVEYDLAGFPEDGVVPTEPTHPGGAHFGAGAPGGSAGLSSSGAPGFVGPNAMGIERTAARFNGGGGDAGGAPAYPCSTPGLIQDADTIRVLCYDYIDHLITQNRGKIAIPRLGVVEGLC